MKKNPYIYATLIIKTKDNNKIEEHSIVTTRSNYRAMVKAIIKNNKTESYNLEHTEYNYYSDLANLYYTTDKYRYELTTEDVLVRFYTKDMMYLQPMLDEPITYNFDEYM
jgi:hypothetical protein